jgi:preprotein translocase subunit SecG
MLDLIFSWDTLWWLIMLLYIPSCFGLIIIVLLQKGKGAGFGGAFGMSGGADTVFGPRMVNSLPQRLTYIMAAIFMVFALVMSIVSGKVARGSAPAVVAEMESGFGTIFGEDEETGAAEEPSEAGATPIPVTTEIPAPMVDATEAPAEAAPVETTEDAVVEAPAEAAPVETTEDAVVDAPAEAAPVETTEDAVVDAPVEAAPVAAPAEDVAETPVETPAAQ